MNCLNEECNEFPNKDERRSISMTKYVAEKEERKS